MNLKLKTIIQSYPILEVGDEHYLRWNKNFGFEWKFNEKVINSDEWRTCNLEQFIEIAVSSVMNYQDFYAAVGNLIGQVLSQPAEEVGDVRPSEPSNRWSKKPHK